MDYFLHIIVLFSIYSILALSLEIVAGQAGLLSLAQAALFGVGAYVTALISMNGTTSLVASALLAMLAGGILAAVVGIATARLSGDIFAVATFGLQAVVSTVFLNWTALTRGPLGLPGIPHPTLFGVEVLTRVQFMVVYGLLLGLSLLFVIFLSASPWGRVLRAIREDEVLAQVLGKHIARTKIEAFVVSGCLAGLAGCAFAFYLSYVEPSSFSVTESLLVLSMVIVGGAGNPLGALLGALVLVGLPEVLRFLGLPTDVAANLRQILYGFLLVGMMMVRPRGLVGMYSFGRGRANSLQETLGKK